MKYVSSRKTRNPVQGTRSHRLRLTWPAWGVSNLATDRTGRDFVRGLSANLAAANSSTMKGPRGLAGELYGRRCRTANDFGWWVSGCFHVRSAEIVACVAHGRNYAGSGEPDIQPKTLPFTWDSDVSRKVEVITNAGSSVVAGVVPGA